MGTKKTLFAVTGEPAGFDPRLIRILVAAMAAVLALLLGFAFRPLAGDRAPWLLFIAAVAVSAWFGGLKPGLLTALPLFITGLYMDAAAPESLLFSGVLFGLTTAVICMAMQRLRMAQFAAQHTSTRLHEVLESTRDAIFSVDTEFRCIYANSRAGQIARKPPAMLHGKSLRTVFPETPAVSIYRELQRAIRERAPLRFEDRMEGSNRWYEFDAYPAPAGLNVFIRDITARKIAEMSAGDEQLRAEEVLMDMPIGIIIASADGRAEFVNRTAAEMFGGDIGPGTDLKSLKRGELRTASGELLDEDQSPLRQTMRSGERVDHAEIEYLRPDGVSITLIISSLPLFRMDGTMRGVLCTYSDVTSIRQMRKALIAGEARLRRLFDSPIIGVISGDGETIVEANDAFLAMLGHSREDVITGRLKWTDLTPPGFEDTDARTIRQLSERGFAEHYQKEYLAKDGRRVPVLVGCAAYNKGHWSPWIAWVLDRTEQQKLENRLRETAKLESIGLLAGGVAHDFNNILTSILGNTSLAFEDLPPDSNARENLKNAIRSTERAADLTRQLLAYAGKGRFVVRPTDVCSHVREIIDLIRTSIPRNVDLELRFAADVPSVRADATQLQQVIMNLVINGAEAIGESPGIVEIIVEPATLTEAWLHEAGLLAELTPGEYVSVEVRDNGSGMDEQTLERIFDPFFTTRFTGRGLGLAAATGIVRAHKGAIRVHSHPGSGSAFTVLLPAIQEPAVTDPAPQPAQARRGAGTILVVDDDAGIRNVVRSALERVGYTVVSATNGKEALDIYRGLCHSISMVILDLTMPKMGGEETLRNLLAINPHAKILLTTGFDRGETVKRLEGRGFAEYIQKPFTASGLAEKVGEILGAPLQ